MKILVRPVVDPQRELDLTNCLVSAIAEELWRLYGGDEQLNWFKAERHLERIVGQAWLEARETLVLRTPSRAGLFEGTSGRVRFSPNPRNPRAAGGTGRQARDAASPALGTRSPRRASSVLAGV